MEFGPVQQWLPANESGPHRLQDTILLFLDDCEIHADSRSIL